MQTQGNSRASLLANLRTGGVRSVSGAMPHSAGPTTTSFQVPRFNQSHAIYEDEEDMIAAQMQHLNFNLNGAMGPRSMMSGPMTTGLAGPNQFQQQQMMMQMMLQQQGMGMGLSAEQQARQLQLQNEILILQAKQQQQQQQFQAQILAQAQAQQAQLQAQIQAAQAAQQAQSSLNNTRLNPVINRRVSAANAVPSTAGPLQTSFNLGNAPAPRRTMSIDQESAAPMTAAISGRFGTRAPSLSAVTALNPNAAAFSFGARIGSPTKENHEAGAQSASGSPPHTSTTVISGGTSLGASASAPIASRAQADPSWRRSSSSSPESPVHRLSPPARDQSPILRARPQPLRFNSALSTTVEAPQSSPSSPEPDVVATSAEGVQTILIDNGHSVGSRSPSNSPTTPVGSEPLPAREEASKRLYEGLGMGRPLPTSQSQLSSAMGSSASLASLSGTSTPTRAVSQAVRQPRGPPTEVSELGPRNFASRVRSKAIGGLEAMMLARNRRQGLDVEAF